MVPILLLVFFGAQPPVDPARTVQGYLDALRALDHDRMMQYVADRWISHFRGEDRERDPHGMRDIRDFERVMHTRWRSRILYVFENAVTVESTEDNDFYRALGIGTRTQIDAYFVREGKVYRTESAGYRHRAGDFRDAFGRFEIWLAGQPESKDPEVFRDGHIVYNGRSASKLTPALHRYRGR